MEKKRKSKIQKWDEVGGATELIYLRDHDIRDMDELAKRAGESSAKFTELSQMIKDAEKRLAEIAVLKTHIINYSKTKDVYVAYRKAGYSKQFFEAHRKPVQVGIACELVRKQVSWSKK